MSENTEGLTPREVQLCRDSFVAGIVANRGGDEVRHWMFQLAADRYPMPMVEVPRVVRDRNDVVDWRVIGDEIEWKMADAFTPRWNRIEPGSIGAPVLSVHRVRILADLLANPTHRVPADEVTP